MKYMLIMRQSAAALEAAADLDFEAVINAMGEYNEAMIASGVLLAGDGLSDAKEGFVVDFASEKPIVTDGPYGEIHELFNGFWMIEAASKEEAMAWATRAPLAPGQKLEVRRVTDASDFEDFADNDHIKKEAEFRDKNGLPASGEH
ncbi:YciI family protein [Microbacteriaceae bacterium VKM Ac-2855]|nr:YciI family protein [Microbacteriaceae bacterium VKM Ac-2855]